MPDAAAVEPEISIKLDRKRTMRMDFNTLIRINDTLGINLLTETLDIKSMTLEKLRRLFWAFLCDDDPDLTEEAVGRLVHPANLAEITTKIVELQNIAVGKATPAKPPAARAKRSR